MELSSSAGGIVLYDFLEACSLSCLLFLFLYAVVRGDSLTYGGGDDDGDVTLSQPPSKLKVGIGALIGISGVDMGGGLN